MAENLDARMADLSWVKRMALDIPYGSDSPAQRLDLFWPEAGEGPFPTLVYVHGGGFAFGDKRDGNLEGYLKCLRRGWALAAVLDCRSAVRFIPLQGAGHGDPLLNGGRA